MATTTFSLNIRKWAEVSKLSVDKVVRAATLEVFSSVIKKSPVDTGRFRGNWQVDQRGFNYEKFDKSGQETIAAITTALATKEIGGVISLINNLPYAERLEYGYSGKAPQGMVRLTAQEFSAAAEAAAAKERR